MSCLNSDRWIRFVFILDSCVYLSQTHEQYSSFMYIQRCLSMKFTARSMNKIVYTKISSWYLYYFMTRSMFFFSTGTIILDRSKNLLNSIESILKLSSRSKIRNSSWSVTSSKFNETYAERKETKMCAAFVKKKYLEEAQIILQKGRLAN